MTEAPGAKSVFARFLWMLFCPMILFVLTIMIVKKGGGWFTPADVAFLIVLMLTILARFWEFRLGSPQTATGEPAGPADLWRYAVGAALVGLGAWLIANYLGNHWYG